MKRKTRPSLITAARCPTSQKTLVTLLVIQRSPLITGQEKKKEDYWKLLRGLNPNTEVCTVR